MQYASSDSSDMPSQFRLGDMHELLLGVADEVREFLALTVSDEEFDALIPPAELDRLASAFVDYLRSVARSVEEVLRDRCSPAEPRRGHEH